MSIPLIIFLIFLFIFSVAIKLGYDPIWFTMVCAGAGVVVYIMNYLPIQLYWLIVEKITGG